MDESQRKNYAELKKSDTKLMMMCEIIFKKLKIRQN